ncbi:MAG TPA: tetratricopeptide repeat protein [Candidatus Nitrosotenuis sp.]|nr:tetratricopeptide repeat protein [Candidatus Nitrosotenuis sp.]
MEQTDELVKNGKVFLAEGRFEEALSNFEQALLLDQKNAQLWNLKGAALRSMGRYDEAIECFNKALELDPADKYAS